MFACADAYSVSLALGGYGSGGDSTPPDIAAAPAFSFEILWINIILCQRITLSTPKICHDCGDRWNARWLATVCWRLFHLPGMVIRRPEAWVLKIAKDSFDLFLSIHARSFALAQALAP